jgi:DnaK suppressor protein
MSGKAKTPVKAEPAAKKAAPASKAAPAPKAAVAVKAAAPKTVAPKPAPAAPAVASKPARGTPAAVGLVSTTRIEGAQGNVASVPVPPRVVPPRQVVDPKDVAAAHEYLTSRSATRSEEAIVVNGRQLPTEEQLLKMSDDDYMNAEQLAFFRHRLQEIERELLANADETTEHLRETVIVPDPADRATIEEEHALELRTRDRERKLLKKVQGALVRIDAGEYGYCEETGDPIGIPRLLARPTATLSLEAQQRREMKQKLYGD